MPRGHLHDVNLLQGTDSHHGFSTGNTLPLVARPFGMNHWSAQTRDGRWFFSPHDRWLLGVRCTHQPSPWMGDYGQFMVMANTGEAMLSARRRARSFRPEYSPAEFKTELVNDGTTLEVTPTVRGAIFRFRFAAKGRVIFDSVGFPGVFELQADGQTLIGHVTGNAGGVPEGFAHYVVGRFDRPVMHVINQEDDKGILTAFEFAEGGEVILRLATSFISAEQAALNLEQELGQRSYEEVLAETEAIWSANLGRIEVETEDEAARRTFYSCLYRTQLFPRVWHEVTTDGSLAHRSPYDGQIHPGILYTDNGFWDTYRTVYPLYALLQPEQLAEILQGWTNAYKEGGWFPQWATPGYRACMVGTHIDAVMADGVARGVTEFDVETALEGLLKHADTVGDPNGAWGRIGIEDYQRLGYVSTDHHESVARSLDYAYDDWCIAQVATYAGRHDEAARLIARSKNYVHLYDPEVGFMRGKDAEGKWLEPWDEFHWGDPYVEGGPWQSSWAVQHDIPGLIQLMGGESAFVEKLDRMLTTPPRFTTGAYGLEIHEMTEMAMANFGQYAHSNQPVHHVLYLYTEAGRPDRTQKEVRRVMDELYTPTHLPGDEDNGEMCAWYVLSALGIFPLTPGEPTWTLGSPRFPKVTVTLPNGGTLVVEAPGNTAETVYVSGVSLNGRPVEGTKVSHAELASGGTLTFTMSAQP